MLSRCIFALLVVLAAVLPATAALTETPLGEAIPTAGVPANFFSCSADGQHFAHMAMPEKDRVCVVVDGKPGMLFEQSTQSPVAQTFTFSPDSTRTAYTAVLKGKVHAVVDEQPGPPFDEVRRPLFSADSKSLAYWARTGTNWVRMVDGKETLRHTINPVRPPVFSVYGEHLAIVETHGAQVRLLVDGVPGAPYDKIDAITLTDGNPCRVAYIAHKGKAVMVVADGNESPAYTEVRELSFTVDDRHLLYIAVTGGKQMAVIDGIQKRAYDQVMYLYANSDASGLAYLASREGKWCVVWNDLEGPLLEKKAFKVLSTWYFPQDGQHLGYILLPDDTHMAFVVDNHMQPPVQALHYYEFAISPDGTHCAYVAKKGWNMQLMVDGKLVKSYASISMLRFGADGTSLIFNGRDKAGNRGVFVNDQLQPAVSAIWQVATPDGKHVISLAQMKEATQLSVDNTPNPPASWQAYIADNRGKWFFFDNPRNGHFFANRDGIDLRIDVEIPGE